MDDVLDDSIKDFYRNSTEYQYLMDHIEKDYTTIKSFYQYLKESRKILNSKLFIEKLQDAETKSV